MFYKCTVNSRALEPLSQVVLSSPKMLKEHVGTTRTYIRPVQKDLDISVVLYGNSHVEAIVDWRKSASSTGTFVSIIMTGTVTCQPRLESALCLPVSDRHGVLNCHSVGCHVVKERDAPVTYFLKGYMYCIPVMLLL